MVRSRSVCIYVSRLSLTDEAMCIVSSKRNSGTYKL